LQFVGIPPQVIVNVCQDSNRDGICGGGELFTKVVINKGDSLDDILEKISLTSDGRYFLQTLTPELPIIVELQDAGKVNFDNGKFSLFFNGFKTQKNDKEIKEISILETMVDTNALSKDIADKFRTLTNKEAQNKYYTALFDVLETNINTLRANDLDSKTAVTTTIKEMGEKIKANQEQADRINNCGDNQSCVDSEIKNIHDELEITPENSTPENSTPENSGSATSLEGAEVQYGKWIKPSRNDCESGGGRYSTFNTNLDEDTNYEGTEYTECLANWEKANNICSAIGGVLPKIKRLNDVVTECGGVIDDYDNNKKNEAYQACYRENGFSPDYYWSISINEYNPNDVLILRFNDGNNGLDSKLVKYSIRCIRGE